MRTRARRRIDAIVLAVAVLLVGGVAAVGAALGDGERITGMWVGADLGADGDALVVE